MKVKKGYILRQLVTEWMVVTVGDAAEEFNGMLRLNAAGAMLWKRLEKGASRQQLVQALMEEYQGLDENTATNDVNSFLEKIKSAVEDDKEE